jgi:6-phosphogluconate dehydrogenase
MQIGMIGLGRMGANMVRRLTRGGHQCVVYDMNPESVSALQKEGAVGSSSMNEFVSKLKPPRAIWMMVPAAVVDKVVTQIAPLLQEADILIDGGNSFYVDDIKRAKELAPKGIQYVDVGTSGGVWGLERGYCLMIGGPADVVQHLDPIFKTLAPGSGSISPTPERKQSKSTAEEGYLHCGAAGGGHFVKMVHNGIEYGLMAAYAEGLNVLRHANVGMREHATDAETAPLRNPENYQYEFPIGEITELWRRGSVVASWLLDLIANALARDPDLTNFGGKVADSGEGRWTIHAAIEEGTPVPVLSASLYQRFSSRGADEFAQKLLSAMRFEFGGHSEKK